MRWRDHLWTLAKSSVGSVVCVIVELGLLEALNRLRVPLAMCFAAIQIIGALITFSFNKYWAFGAARSGRSQKARSRSPCSGAASY